MCISDILLFLHCSEYKPVFYIKKGQAPACPFQFYSIFCASRHFKAAQHILYYSTGFIVGMSSVDFTIVYGFFIVLYLFQRCFFFCPTVLYGSVSL